MREHLGGLERLRRGETAGGYEVFLDGVGVVGVASLVGGGGGGESCLG